MHVTHSDNTKITMTKIKSTRRWYNTRKNSTEVARCDPCCSQRKQPKALKSWKELNENQVEIQSSRPVKQVTIFPEALALFPRYKAGSFAPASKPTWTLNHGLHKEFVYKNIIYKNTHYKLKQILLPYLPSQLNISKFLHNQLAVAIPSN